MKLKFAEATCGYVIGYTDTGEKKRLDQEVQKKAKVGNTKVNGFASLKLAFDAVFIKQTI